MPSAFPCDGTSRNLLDDIRTAYPEVTDARIAHWLGIDASLVARWRDGSRAMPVWALGRLIRRLGDARPVLGELAAIAGCEIVVVPTAEAAGRDLLRVAAGVTRVTASLADEVGKATDPRGEGGAALTTGERAGLLAELDVALQQLAQLRADVEASRPGRRAA